jgi:hypothetical protein
MCHRKFPYGLFGWGGFLYELLVIHNDVVYKLVLEDLPRLPATSNWRTCLQQAGAAGGELNSGQAREHGMAPRGGRWGSPCAARALVWSRRTPNRRGPNTAQRNRAEPSAGEGAPAAGGWPGPGHLSSRSGILCCC